MGKRYRAFSTLGNIALVNFSDEAKEKDKKEFAKELLKNHSNIKTVLEKSGIFKGRLRKMKTGFLGGVDTREVLYKENGCEFRFNIDETYFSPRLANERIEIANLIEKGERVFVMFAGVGPFSIVIGKNSEASEIYSNELNRKANEYGEINIERNKLKDRVKLVPGDVKKVCEKFRGSGEKFDVIVMPRPQLKDSFLEDAFKLVKKKTRIYYYDFCRIDEIDSKVEMVKEEALKAGKKINILKVKEAGEIAPFKARIRIDFEILGKNWWNLF